MDLGQRLAVQASRLAPRGRRTGVTGAGCWIWSELGRGGGAKVRGDLRLGPRTGDGWLEAAASDFVRMSWEVQTLPPQPTHKKYGHRYTRE